MLPELAPEFRNLVANARKIKGDELTIIDRCNLTVFYEPGQEDLGEFLKEHDVTAVASLPWLFRSLIRINREEKGFLNGLLMR